MAALNPAAPKPDPAPAAERWFAAAVSSARRWARRKIPVGCG